MRADDTLYQIDELRLHADELPAPQRELLGEFIRLISSTLAVTRMSPETLSAWRDMLARMRQTLENSEIDKSSQENTSSPILEDVKDTSETSRAIGIAQIPDDVLRALLSNRHLRSASRMSIMVFDKPWKEEVPTSYATVVAEWHRRPEQMRLAGTRLPFVDSDKLTSLLARDTLLVIEDIKQDKRVEQSIPNLIDQDCTIGLILCPLVAGGQWYGLFIAQYDKAVSPDIVSHIRGLLEQAALAVYTMLLFEAEARSRQAAEQANNQKMKLLATISHEMRTPLTSIKGFATTLLADDVEWSPESQRDFVETINQEADKLSELIEHLLSHSRLEAGTLPIKPKEKYVQDIISLAMAQLQTLAVNHVLKIHIPADLPPVYADPRRIAQVLTNLVKNAAEYSPHQSMIEITVSLQDTHIEFDVSDQGLGIPPEEHTQVFEAFHRGARAREIQRQGTGLGLAICKGIIEAHHGKIWVQDRLEPGTTISFTLPIYDAHAERYQVS